MRMVRSGHIVDIILKVRAGNLDMWYVRLQVYGKNLSVCWNCHSFLIVLSYFII